MGKVKIVGVSVATREFEIDGDDYARARDAGRLDHELDSYLSDMGDTTVIVDQETGQVINPFDGETDLMKILRPAMDQLPTWRLIQYLEDRRAAGS